MRSDAVRAHVAGVALDEKLTNATLDPRGHVLRSLIVKLHASFDAFQMTKQKEPITVEADRFLRGAEHDD
jgi:hypothetical protein